MSRFIRMNESQMLSSLDILQDKIDDRCGNTITLEQTIEFLSTVIYEVDFNASGELSAFIDNFLDKIGMER